MSWYSDSDELLISCAGCGKRECCSGCQDEPGWTEITLPQKPKAKYKGGPLRSRPDKTLWYCPRQKCVEQKQQRLRDQKQNAPQPPKVETQVEEKKPVERDDFIRTFYYYSWRKWFVRVFDRVNVEFNLERWNSWRIEVGTYYTSFVLQHYKWKSNG